VVGKAFDLARDIASSPLDNRQQRSASLESNSPPSSAATECDLARQLQAKIGRAQDQLLIFCGLSRDSRGHQQRSERKLRPCVIQRKVHNGYRAMWAGPSRG